MSILLDAVAASFYLYAVIFAASFFALFYGIRMLYKAVANKDEEGIRKSKFILLFAVIAMLCVTIVCFFITGKLPVD